MAKPNIEAVVRKRVIYSCGICGKEYGDNERAAQTCVNVGMPVIHPRGTVFMINDWESIEYYVLHEISSIVKETHESIMGAQRLYKITFKQKKKGDEVACFEEWNYFMKVSKDGREITNTGTDREPAKILTPDEVKALPPSPLNDYLKEYIRRLLNP